MHGTIQLTSIHPTPGRTRKGRKRKMGKRSPTNCRLISHQPNYREMAGMQPHRVGLPERFRLDRLAVGVMGELLLTERLAPHGDDGKPSERALALHEAARKYAAIIGRYRSMIGIPPLAHMQWITEANGKQEEDETVEANGNYECFGETNCDPERCECLNREQAYNTVNNLLAKLGHRLQIVVNRTVIHDEACPDWQLPVLLLGLGTLAKHFGLKS